MAQKYVWRTAAARFESRVDEERVGRRRFDVPCGKRGRPLALTVAHVCSEPVTVIDRILIGKKKTDEIQIEGVFPSSHPWRPGCLQ